MNYIEEHDKGWRKVARKLYFDFGFRHTIPLIALFLYLVFGATIFVFIEGPADEFIEEERRLQLKERNIATVELLMPKVFNEQTLLLHIDDKEMNDVKGRIEEVIELHDRQLIKLLDKHANIHWDFWNAMLYSCTICTTIGYGHLYPRTAAGRIVTMLYSLIGIPLVLMILQDLGKLLTKVMKFPWFLVKKWGRRILQCCTRMSREKMMEAEEKDRKNLEVFDLPLLVAIGIVVGWIFICSAIFCIWEDRWDYLIAFYFFFISLSTIGLGDIVPDKPRYLLMMTFLIIIGLSLVSMCINLIQAKFENTYKTDNTKKYKNSIGVLSLPTQNGHSTTFLKKLSSISLPVNILNNVNEDCNSSSAESSIQDPDQIDNSIASASPSIRKSSLSNVLSRLKSPRQSVQFHSEPALFDHRSDPERFSQEKIPPMTSFGYKLNLAGRVGENKSSPEVAESLSQTYLSFPQYLNGDVIICDERGSRKFPTSTSIEGLSRAIEMNIDADILRRELNEIHQTYFDHNTLPISREDLALQIAQEAVMNCV